MTLARGKLVSRNSLFKAIQELQNIIESPQEEFNTLWRKIEEFKAVLKEYQDY